MMRARSILTVGSVLFISIVLASNMAFGQTNELGDRLSQVGEQYARAYLAPFTEAFGADMNSGFFHTASLGKRVQGLNIYLGFKASGTYIRESDKVFSMEFQGEIPQTIDFGDQQIEILIKGVGEATNAPTIVGSDTAPMVKFAISADTLINYNGLPLPFSTQADTSFETIGGLGEIPILPSAVPQIGLGTLMGTDLMIRWLPEISISDYGKGGYFWYRCSS